MNVEESVFAVGAGRELAVGVEFAPRAEPCFRRVGLAWDDYYHEDRDDDLFMLLPAEVPKKVLVGRCPLSGLFGHDFGTGRATNMPMLDRYRCWRGMQASCNRRVHRRPHGVEVRVTGDIRGGVTVNEIAWLSVPVGMDAGRWVTRDRYRTVLVAVHTMVAAQRLLDVVCAVETDLRVQVVFTQAPDVFHGGVDQLLHDLGALVLPWQQAVHERFDLVLAAAYTGLDQLHGPVMVLPHGAGYGKRAAGGSSRGVAAVYGLDAQRLVRDGHLVASSIVLSHTSQQRVLRRQCPAAVDAAVVAGDPCYDRLRASLLLRPLYRAAFDVAQDRQFVLVASTWGRQSLVGRNIELIARLMEQLDPRRYCVAALIHPAVWAGHGARQLRAWLQDAIGSGLTLIEPDVDWRAALLAADYVIGDHGSVTVYATSLGIPVLTTAPADDTLDPRSPQAWVSQHAPKLAVSEPLEPQLRQVTVAAARAGRAAVVRRLTSRPGESYRALREEMYRLLKLPILGKHRSPEPIAVRPSRRSSRHG